MEREIQPGDKVRIKPDYPGWLLSSLAEQKWRPENTLLELKNRSSDGDIAVVEGSQGVFSGLITQAVPMDSLERASAESDGTVSTPSQTPTSLASLAQGTIFSNSSDLCMKTDESDDDLGYTTYYRCVVLAGGYTGLIVYVPGNKMVTPKPEAGTALESVFDTNTDAFDPWDLAETQYGKLEPGDVFRRDRGDGHDSRCFVVALKDDHNDYRFIDEDGDLMMGLFEETKVYRDDVLTDHGL